jgi:hypothetical protein
MDKKGGHIRLFYFSGISYDVQSPNQGKNSQGFIGRIQALKD